MLVVEQPGSQAQSPNGSRILITEVYEVNRLALPAFFPQARDEKLGRSFGPLTCINPQGPSGWRGHGCALKTPWASCMRCRTNLRARSLLFVKMLRRRITKGMGDSGIVRRKGLLGTSGFEGEGLQPRLPGSRGPTLASGSQGLEDPRPLEEFKLHTSAHLPGHGDLRYKSSTCYIVGSDLWRNNLGATGFLPAGTRPVPRGRWPFKRNWHRLACKPWQSNQFSNADENSTEFPAYWTERIRDCEQRRKKDTRACGCTRRQRNISSDRSCSQRPPGGR